MVPPIFSTEDDLAESSGYDTGTTRDLDLRKYDTIYPDTGVRDGRATYLSCLRRGYNLEFARRVVDWERKHPPVPDGLATTDRYLARNAMPLGESQSPICAPTVHLYPPPFLLELPPGYRASRSLFLGRRMKSQSPICQLKKLNLHPATPSTSPQPTSKFEDDQRTVGRTENVWPRQYPPVSYQTEGFSRNGIVRSQAQVNHLQDQRGKREEEERKERRRQEPEKPIAGQETGTDGEKRSRLEVLPIWLKDLAITWREKHPGPAKLFRKDFNFGPKTLNNDDYEYRRPLSPLSTEGSLSSHSPVVMSKSLKRERHDCSLTDVARESPHDRLHATSSPISIQPAKPALPTSRFLSGRLGSADVHPGQRVDFTACVSSEFGKDFSNEDRVRSPTSERNYDDADEYFDTEEYGPLKHLEEYRGPTQLKVFERASSCEADLRHRLQTVFNQQGKLKHSADESQATFDEELAMQECELQRKSRAIRDDPPTSMPIPSAGKMEPRVTRWSPMMHSGEMSRTTRSSAALLDERLKRKRSYVARCRSTDAFLRDVRESQRRRQMTRDVDCEQLSRQQTPDPAFPEQQGYWLGDNPL